MLAQSSEDGIQTARQWLRSGFAWWIGELRAMIPDNLRSFFASVSRTIEVDVTPMEVIVVRRTGQSATVLARIVHGDLAPQMLANAIPQETGIMSWFADPVVVRVPPDGALECNLKLPRTAKHDLPDIMRHEVGRQSPVDAANIYYGYRAVPDVDGLRVRLRMVRREGIDAAVNLCRAAKIDPSAIAFTDERSTVDGGNFPVSAKAARARLNRMKLIPRLITAAVILAILFLGAMFLRGEWVRSDLSDRVVAAQISAQSIERLQRQIAMSEKGAALLSRQKRDPATVQVLAEVTRILPDGAWLYEIEMSRGEVRIHGFARAAASLIALFDSSPLFRDAQFRSPLMQGPNGGLERFDMSFKLKPAT